MSLADLHPQHGAILAHDGIPLHYGDLKAEYEAGMGHAVLMDRSHEGRLTMQGRDRLALLQRISTNDVLKLAVNDGCPTIFTNPNGRILDRVTVYNRNENVLLLTEPGRGPAVHQYLQRNIFFNDQLTLTDVAAATRLFVLHGPQAEAVIHQFSQTAVPEMGGAEMVIADTPVYLAQRKPISGTYWALLVPLEYAETVWQALQAVGAPFGLRLAGSLTYNTLRIRAGRPAAGHELTTDYIPLEAGLWDEVSFQKGCYTGQEIIARMESRNRLAKTLVTARLETFIAAPAILSENKKPVGMLTSSVTTPRGDHLGLGFVKIAQATPGQILTAGEIGVKVEIIALAGTPPPLLTT